MTGDARGEAEQIVGTRLRPTVAGETYAQTADRNDFVVAALAAAIDHVTANDDVPDDYSVGSWDMDADTFRALRDALSALRDRAGGET